MQDIKDLIDFIQKTKFKSNTLLHAIIRPDSQMGRMYHAIAAGKVHSDQELLDLLPELSNLKKVMTLKTRLKNRLCDAVFLLDFREESSPDRQRAFVECVKKWSAAMILISKNIRSIGVRQLENLLRHTLEFEFTEISMNIIRTLELYYGTLEGDQKKYNELETRLIELEAIWHAEREVERLYTDLVVNYVNARADKHLAAKKASEHFTRIEPYLKRFDAFKIHFFSFLIQTIAYDGVNNYNEMEVVCLRAVKFFSKKKYRSGMVEQTFYYNLITCYLYTRQFKKGQVYVQVLEEMLEENSFNWFKVQELYFMMAMHTENYLDGFQVLLRVKNSPFLAAQPSHVTEIWKIFEAYTQYLILAGEITGAEADVEYSTFRLSRFINDLTVFTKDKRGMNIAVQIVEFLFYVAQRRVEECENRMDALKKYCSRYLNDETTLRSRLFIRMLLQIPHHLFDLNLIRQKTADSLEQLLQMPWHTVNQHREVEIIPYEILWPIVLRLLESPALTRPSRPNAQASGQYRSWR